MGKQERTLGLEVARLQRQVQRAHNKFVRKSMVHNAYGASSTAVSTNESEKNSKEQGV